MVDDETHRPAQGSDERKNGPAGRIAPFAAIGLLLLKWGKFLFLFLKAGKFLPTLATMLLSMVVYATIFGAPYAVGFVALLLVHEMGHFLAARRRGLNVGAPAFIPFVGAWIQLKSQPLDVATEAYVAFAGPLFGTAAALGCYWIGRMTGNDLYLALAYTGLFINLFNLIPLAPLDGGRITAILSPRIWLLGVPILVALFFYRPSPILLLVAILALPNLIKAWRYDPKDPKNAQYYAAPLAQKLQYGVLYLGLTAFLAIMMQELHQGLSHLQ